MRFGNNIFPRVVLLAVAGAMASCCHAGVEVKNAWVKLAPPLASVNAAYMQFSNPQPMPQTIIRVSADCCALAMLHQTRHMQDRVVMDHLSELMIPAQAVVELKPGGAHIMLRDARQSLAINDTVIITLTFSDGTEQKVHAVVRADKYDQ